VDKKIIESETKINNILFRICFFITILAIAMALLGFFSRGLYPPSNISVFYVGILIIYAVHKEAIRFLRVPKTEKVSKQGELFVYAWIIITACLYVINFITNNYFSRSPDGLELNTLMNITFTTLEVGAVFVLTRVFKLLMIRFFHRK